MRRDRLLWRGLRGVVQPCRRSPNWRCPSRRSDLVLLSCGPRCGRTAALEAALAGGGDSALDGYGATRRPIAEQVVALADRLTRVATIGRELRPLRNVVLRALAMFPGISACPRVASLGADLPLKDVRARRSIFKRRESVCESLAVRQTPLQAAKRGRCPFESPGPRSRAHWRFTARRTRATLRKGCCVGRRRRLTTC